MPIFADPIPNAPGLILVQAMKENNLKVLKILLTRRFDGNWGEMIKTWYRPTPLQAAVETGNPDVINLFSSCGAPFSERELRLAARRGYKEIVELLLEYGVRANADTLHAAVEEGHREIVELLLARGIETNPHAAAMIEDMARVKEYLERDAQVDADKSDRLEVVLREGRQDLAELLVERGAQLNLSGDIDALLARYAEMGCLQVVELLIGNGADVNHQVGKEFMPLHLAATNGHRDVAECLIDNGALLDAFAGQDGVAPLHCAVWESHLNVVKLLLERGANVNIKRTVGEQYWRGSWWDDPPLWSASKGTPLHLVWDKDIAELLIARGADVNARDAEYDSTPLHAVMEKFFGEIEEIVELLIRGGADVNATDKYGSTPLHLAIEYGYFQVVELLIAAGADLNVKDRNGSTLLDKAVDTGDIELIQFLIARGVDVDADRKNNTPTLRALSKSKLDIAEMLIFSGADVNLTNRQGETVLHQAVKNGLLNLVELALAADADVNAKDKNGHTPLTVALENSYMEKVNLLIANGADVNLIKNKQGSPLLHELIDRRQTEVVRLLILNGADVNARDKSDRSVLHCAVQSNWKEIVEFLLDRGADINAKRKASFTPLDDAIESGNLELADLLVASGALVNKKQVARISALLSLPDAKEKGYVNLVAKVQNRKDFSV